MFKRYTLFKRGEIYYAQFRDELGKRLSARSTGKTSETSAEIWCEEELRKAGEIQSNITFNRFCENMFVWGKCSIIDRALMQGRRFGKSYADHARQHLRNYILPFFGATEVIRIKPKIIYDFLSKLKIGGATKNSILNTLKIIFDEAIYQSLIEINPAKNIKPFKSNSQKRDIFTPTELHKLFPVDDIECQKIWTGLYWYALFYLMVSTGIRLGEIRALRWYALDLDLKIITISEALKAGTEIVGPPKSGKPRSGFLPDRTVRILNDWRKMTLYNSINDLVFYGSEGIKFKGRKTIERYFYVGIENAKIEVKDRNIVLHSLRHQYNTLTRPILSPELLRMMIGHSTNAMTENYDARKSAEKLIPFEMEKEKLNGIFN